MDYTVVFILFFSTMSLVIQAQINILIRKVTEMSDLLEEYVSGDVEYGELESTSVQEHVIEREEKFDKRISQIKQEIGMSDAEELHPDVKNLPHEEINQTRPPIEEYSI